MISRGEGLGVLPSWASLWMAMDGSHSNASFALISWELESVVPQKQVLSQPL